MRNIYFWILMGAAATCTACSSPNSDPEPRDRAPEVVPQQQTGPAVQVEPIYLVRSSLRAVASAQHAHWQKHNTYTTDLEVLKQYPGCEIKDGVTVRVVDGSEDGFAMEATHPEFPGRSCVQWYGREGLVTVVATAREGKRGDDKPGMVVCDAP